MKDAAYAICDVVQIRQEGGVNFVLSARSVQCSSSLSNTPSLGAAHSHIFHTTNSTHNDGEKSIRKVCDVASSSNTKSSDKLLYGCVAPPEGGT